MRYYVIQALYKNNIYRPIYKRKNDKFHNNHLGSTGISFSFGSKKIKG